MRRVFKDYERVWFEEDHMSGWGNVALTGTNPPPADIFYEEDIVTVAKDTGGEIECLARDVYRLAEGLTHEGLPVVWEHDSDAGYPLYCPDKREGVAIEDTDVTEKGPIEVILLLGEHVCEDFLRRHRDERHTPREWIRLVESSPEKEEGLHAMAVELKSDEELKGFISGVALLDDDLSEDHYHAMIIKGDMIAKEKKD